MKFLKKFLAFMQWFAVEFLLRKIIIPIVLVSVYFFGVGPTSLFAKIFARKQLVKNRDKNSNWTAAEGFEVTDQNKTWQS